MSLNSTVLAFGEKRQLHNVNHFVNVLTSIILAFGERKGPLHRVTLL